MTSASELFFNRRYRFDSRNPTPGLADEGLTIHRRQLHRRSIRSDDGHGQPVRRVFFFGEEHESPRSNNSGPDNSRTSNSSSRAVSSRINRASLIQNDRLPGSVLQARARLLQRLHGIDSPEDRFSSSSGITVSEPGTANVHNWETEVAQEWNEFDVREVTAKKPPGLSKEMIYNLPQEIYSDLRENDDIIKACYECCICLEKFKSGERLFSLPCSHRFHPPCLEPWLENCGDCPYCRASI